MPVDVEQAKQDLRMILDKAKISPDLRKVVRGILEALERNDMRLASELSSVKSFVTGSMDVRGYRFREDAEYNRQVLGGTDVYIILDGMHHELAFTLQEMPSGRTVLSSRGVGRMPDISGRGRSALSHPLVRLIQQEKDATRRRVEKSRRKR